jgi:hypothetical protein
MRSESAQREAEEYLLKRGVEPFQGDPVAFMCSIYKDHELPLQMRLDAARSAAPFVKPRLSCTRVEIKPPAQMTDDELAAFLAAANSMIAPRDRDEEETRH